MINWSTVRKHAWYEGVIALLMAPTAYPIALWYFNGVMPIAINTTLSGWDVFGQIVLALLTGLFALAAGLAIDIGLVRIATGVPTHGNRFASLTFLVPVVFWMMACLITYDKYSDHEWSFRMTTLVHLAYPTASMFAALYWSWSKDWESSIKLPLMDQIETLHKQLTQLVSIDVVKELQARIDQLSNDLLFATRRADEHERLSREAGAIASQLGAANNQAISDLRLQHQKNLADQHSQMTAEIERLRGKFHDIQEAARRQREQMQAEITDLQSRQTEAGSFQFTTMREAIDFHLAINPELSNDALALELRVKPDQLGTFRSQVSQARSAMKRQAQEEG